MSQEINNSAIFGRHVLGTAGLGGVWGKVDREESVAVILKALEDGFMGVDTAPAYGDAEEIVGQALKDWKGAPPAISTKVGRLRSYASDSGVYDYSAEGMTKSIQNSLEILGVACIDTLFLHEPDMVPPSLLDEAVEQLLRFKDAGYVRSIGLGGNCPPLFQKYIDAAVFDVAMEYNRLDACCLKALHTTLPKYTLSGMSYWSASPLHMGLLGRRFDAFVQRRPAWLSKSEIEAAVTVNEIAEAQGLSLAELALRFIQNIQFDIKIVVGPANSQEYENVFVNIGKGPLDQRIFNQIITSLNENQSSE